MRIVEGRVRVAASDVANFLACQHLTRLDLLAARGELKPPKEFDVGFLDLVAFARGKTWVGELKQALREGNERAEAIAAATLDEVRAAMGMRY